jgi:hypothetical protein
MLASLLMLFSAVSAHAVDTSGCTPMRLTTTSVATAQNNSVVATLARAPRAGCWNEKNSAISVEYRFTRAASARPNSASLWISVNGQTQTIASSVNCGSGGGISYGKNTDSNAPVYCTASAVVSAPANGSIELEVAPAVDGQSDTYGYGRNTVIRF